MELLLRVQGNNDLGEQIKTENDTVLELSPAHVVKTGRAISGHHHFEEFSYSSGNKSKIQF